MAFREALFPYIMYDRYITINVQYIHTYVHLRIEEKSISGAQIKRATATKLMETRWMGVGDSNNSSPPRKEEFLFLKKKVHTQSFFFLGH